MIVTSKLYETFQGDHVLLQEKNVYVRMEVVYCGALKEG